MATPQTIFNQLFSSYPTLISCKDDIIKAFEILKETACSKAWIFTCGNGGSAADCEHITGELMKGFLLKRPLSASEKEDFCQYKNGQSIADKLQKGIKCISLVSQSGLITAFANDIDASLIYAQQIYAYADSEKDTLIALSTSGNSQNIVNAVIASKAAGINSIGITGKNDSELSKLCTVTIKIPESETYKIQELTLPVYHSLCAALESALFTQ